MLSTLLLALIDAHAQLTEPEFRTPRTAPRDRRASTPIDGAVCDCTSSTRHQNDVADTASAAPIAGSTPASQRLE
jgi:hypothetical protein